MSDEPLGGLRDGTYRARWLRKVVQTPQIADAVRVLLMTLAMQMDARGRVSVPREELVELLGRSPRKVAERLKAALESGFLVQTARGQKHQTAVYWAAIDGESLSVPPGDPAEQAGASDVSMPPGGQADDSQGAGSKHPEPNSQGATNRHPENSEPDLSMPPGGPPENSQHAPRGAPQSFIGVDVVEEVDVSDGSLFGVERAASRRTRAKPDKPATTKPAPANSRRKPETPIPVDFAVTDAMRRWATDKGYTVDLDRETFRFINHARQHDRRLRDWLAGWHNWIDKAQEISDRDGTRSAGPVRRAANGSGPEVPKNRTYSDNPEDYR